MMRQFLVGILALYLTSPSFALSIEVYENHIAQQSGNPSIFKDIPPLLIDGYLSGVAETLSFLHSTGGKKIMMGISPIICLPATTQVSVDLLKAVITVELSRQSAHYENAYGSTWKGLVLSTVIITGLQRMFPCQITSSRK